MILAEKEAEDFLEKKGFNVVDRVFVDNFKDGEKFISMIGFPFVMKAFGKKIIHKKKVGGVAVGIKSKDDGLKAFDRFKKIPGFEGVVIQKQVKGKEILIGLKSTPEFDHVLVFGQGGSDVERKADVSFRACPLSNEDYNEMINDTLIGKTLDASEKKQIISVMKKINDLTLKFKINELDINPLMVNSKECWVVDARIVFN